MTILTTLAASALAHCAAITSGQECAGAIYETRDGQYHVTEPTLSPNDRHFTIRVRMPKDAHIVALWHTHDVAPNSELFSQDDINTANALNVPSYVLVLGPSPKLIVYVPKVDSVTYSLSLGHTSTGHLPL